MFPIYNIIKYQTDADGLQNDTRLIYGGVGGDQFACDQDHLCERSRQGNKAWIRNVTYNGRSGDLYCCHTSRCNDPHVVTLPQPSVPCFIGSTSPNGTRDTLKICSTGQCLNLTRGDVTEYRCDTQGLCSNHQMTQECTQIKDGFLDKRLCCCDKDTKGCNLGVLTTPPAGWHAAPPPYRHLVAAHQTRPQPTVRPMDPMPAGARPEPGREQKSRVAGIVSAAVLGTALVVLVIVIGVKQWQRYREKYNFSYMQLTADMMVL